MSEASKPEIVIIRRGNHAHEDGHHGGVWKIAFADFMTAMMAFFLVLWIVNSSSKETRASIARYFNPVKLSDTTPARKGLREARELDFDASDDDPNKPAGAGEEDCGAAKSEAVAEGSSPGRDHDSRHGADNGKAKGAKKAKAKGKSGGKEPGCGAAAPRPRFAEDQLMSAPQAVLTSIVEGAAVQPSRARDQTVEGETVTGETSAFPNPDGHPGLLAEPVFRDPFAPISPVLAARGAAEGKPVLKSDARPSENAGAAGIAASAQPSSMSVTPASPQRKATDLTIVERPGDAAVPALGTGPAASIEPQIGSAASESAARLPETPPASPRPGSAGQGADGRGPAPVFAGVAADIKSEVDAMLKDELGRSGPVVEIHAEKEGTLISLTDGLDFGMFAIGSAEPQPRTIAIMAKLAAVLKRHDGPIVVRGHTDARPYAGARYDNWHLSSDRAQIAFQMLLRGGLDPRRLERVEGHADRLLRNRADPGAAENRRIEILVKAAS